MQDDRLADRHVVVTGAAQGIGRGIAVRAARAGADVTVFDVKADGTEETASRIRDHGSSASVQAVDVTDADAVGAAIDAAVEELGSIDGLVNNAGVQMSVPIRETTEADWDRHFDVNAKGVFLTSRAVADHMVDAGVEGNIVNVASVAAVRPFEGQGAYGASKAAVETFTVVLAKELAEHGITANAINPGTIETPMVEQWLAENAEARGVTPDEVLQETVDAHLLDRIGQPEEIGHVAVLLLSDEGNWITGETVAVDGGYTVG